MSTQYEYDVNTPPMQYVKLFEIRVSGLALDSIYTFALKPNCGAKVQQLF